MGVSKNRGTPKLSILIGFSLINHPFWGTTIFGSTHIPWFRLITPPFTTLVFTIAFDQNSIGRLNVELRQSLSADINTEPLGLRLFFWCWQICWAEGCTLNGRKHTKTSNTRIVWCFCWGKLRRICFFKAKGVVLLG